MMFHAYKVYTDHKSVVLLENSLRIVSMSKVSKGDTFDFYKGMMVALIRAWAGWDHPDLKNNIQILDDPGCYVGMFCSLAHTISTDGPLFYLAHRWEIVDKFSDLSSLHVMTSFFPAD